MSDARHKRSPVKGKLEDVTPLFVKQVAAALALNDAFNTQHKLRKEDPRYRICTHAELADAVGCDPNMLKHMLGGVRTGTKTKKIERSRLVAPVRAALGIPQMASVLVPANRLALFQRLAALPDDVLKDVEHKILAIER